MADPDGPGRRRDRAAVVAIALVTAFAIAALELPRIRSDGIAYYLWLEAFVRDGTIDLGAAAARHAPFITYHAWARPGSSRTLSLFPFGAALLWAPFYAAGLTLDRVLGPSQLDAWSLALQGDTYRPVLSVCLGSGVLAVAAALLTFAVCRRHAGTAASVFATLATFFGTPLYYYAARDPSFSHAPATFVLAALLLSALRARRPADWLMAGALLGLAGMVRWQLLLVAIPLAAWSLRQGLRALFALALPAALLFATVPLSWLYMFGSPWPAAVGTVQTWAPANALLWVLASPVHGLFTWSPLTLLGCAGLVLLALGPATRWLGAGLLLAIATQVYMSATTINPLAGWCFGMRRLTEMYPAFALGLAVLLEQARRQSLRLAWLTFGAASFATAASVLLLLAFEAGLVHPGYGSSGVAWRAWLPPRTGATVAAVEREVGFFRFGLPEAGELPSRVSP